MTRRAGETGVDILIIMNSDMCFYIFMIGCGTNRCDHIYSGILYHEKKLFVKFFF